MRARIVLTHSSLFNGNFHEIGIIRYFHNVKFLFSFCGLLLTHTLFSQAKYVIRDVDIFLNGSRLHNAWCGGLNSPVISEINLNDDELPDLFLFDKYGNKVLPFINRGEAVYPQYLYAPQYEKWFPKLVGWAMIRDFNRDNVPDIFTLNGNYIRCFRGKIQEGQLQFDTLSNRLMYQLGTFNNAIWTFINDLPAFVDVNGDGDLDVMTFDVNGGMTINYYENQSSELGYGADSLLFLVQDLCWGHIAESGENNMISLAACKQDGSQQMAASSASRHQGGTLFAFDYEGDGDVDILLGDVSFPNLVYVQNDGTNLSANVTYIDTVFPHYDIPVNMPYFPAAYTVGNSNHKDLWVAPFTYDGTAGISKDIHNIHLYKNQGSEPFQRYSYAGDTFFVNQIFDVGSDSKAVFEDVDNDGKPDIVVGQNAQYYNGFTAISKLYYLKNISDENGVKFEIQSDDWCNSVAWNLNGIYPAFGDLDGDGLRDMLVGDNLGRLHFLKRYDDSNPFSSITISNYFNISVNSNARPFIFDVNGDGLNDILVGQRMGEIRYFWNFGSSENALFSTDSVNTLFGGVRVNDWRNSVLTGHASPFVQEENGMLFLYSGSERGMIFKYEINADSLRSGTFALVDSDHVHYNVGSRTTIAIADINGDGGQEYLIGNSRGGLMLLSDINWNDETSVNNIDSEKQHIFIYPNPASTAVFVNANFDLNGTNYIVFDIMGKQLLHGKINAENRIPIETLANGSYILQLTNERFSGAQKFVVIK